MKLEEITDSFRIRFKFENELNDEGYQIIAGIDEVGRGCVAGPVVACSCILPANFNVSKTYDSKRFNKRQRFLLEEEIKKTSCLFAFGEASVTEIDRINIYQSARLAMKRSVMNLLQMPDALLIDAMDVDLNLKQLKIIHGDQLSNLIAAASILAKCHRDRIMIKMAEKYPEYGFERNVGYLTSEAKKALLEYGITPIHRKTFAPISKLI
ncbi:ribonuclease HII [Oenococcus oeni]|uniref:ribonuclease HII n=1 Tax=Oenococcus oeni TaxID=1247 RepID=UPI0010B7083F|nr:ribonuclease HII [Oenococcus oeni]SYW15479.1 Ribonuclease HII [Oenococcus oeni]